MRLNRGRWADSVRAGLLALTAAAFLPAMGCGPSSPLGAAGAELSPPEGWSAVAPDRWPVPGVPLAAWAGPGDASLVAYRLLPIPGGTADAFGKALENRLTNLPDVRVLDRRVATVAGREAARVEVVGAGTGDRFAPSGSGRPYAPEGVELRPTRRVVVAIPRARDVLVMAWHAPESDSEALHAAVDATLATLRLRHDPPPPPPGY